MKTRHGGDNKREIMWNLPKATSTEIVPVLMERNAQQPMLERLEQPPLAKKTNRPYTVPQRNRGCGGRDSTKRKESAAALGRRGGEESEEIKMRCGSSGFLATRTNALINDMTIQN